MFERFTNKARHVVVLAQEEAQRLSHNYIGTEHLLLGLLGEPEGVGATILDSFGVTRDGARAEVEEMIGRGKTQPGGHIPFTPRAKKVLELSLREALALRHNYIGTEHLLLGLIREGDGVAAQVMRGHADLLEIRNAVLNSVTAGDPGEPGEPGEGAEETNAVLRWLRQRLAGRNAPAVPPFRLGAAGAEPAVHGTPAVNTALKRAAALAGQTPVGSHHLLLAALADRNSAATWALAQLGVNVDDLREKLRSAPVEGTSDEQPEQAGRRQMSVQVTDETLTLVLTDPVIVAAGKKALRAVNARTASASAFAAVARSVTGEAAGEESPGEGTEAAESAAQESGARSVTATVIRGDLPGAEGLADVWLELRKTLNTLVDPNAARGRRVVRARRPGDPEEVHGKPGSAKPGGDDEPGEGEAASS